MLLYSTVTRLRHRLCFCATSQCHSTQRPCKTRSPSPSSSAATIQKVDAHCRRAVSSLLECATCRPHDVRVQQQAIAKSSTRLALPKGPSLPSSTSISPFHLPPRGRSWRGRLWSSYTRSMLENALLSSSHTHARNRPAFFVAHARNRLALIVALAYNRLALIVAHRCSCSQPLCRSHTVYLRSTKATAHVKRSPSSCPRIGRRDRVR